MSVLETARLTLRRFTPDDVDAIAPIVADPEVMRFSIVGPQGRAGAVALVERLMAGYEKHGFGRWATIERESNTLIGYAGIGMMDGIEIPELGYRLARSHWGRGLATEAALACRDFCHERYGLTRLVALIEPQNLGSIRVAEKAGFVRQRKTQYKHLEVYVYAWRAGPATGQTTSR